MAPQISCNQRLTAMQDEGNKFICRKYRWIFQLLFSDFQYFDCNYPIRLLSLTPFFKVMLRSNTSSAPGHRLRRINLPLNDKFARVPMISYFALGFYCSYKCFKYEIILFLKYKPFLYLLRENCQNFHFIETKYIHNEKRRRSSP